MLPVIACTSSEKQSSERSDQATGKATISPVDDSIPKTSSDPPQLPVITSPAELNRMFKEAEDAFQAKDYSTAVTKIEALLERLGPNSSAPYEMLYFNMALGKMLGGKHADYEIAFRDCLQRYPKGEYTSRAYLGLGRSLMLQAEPAKSEEALEALKQAAADPTCKNQADHWISEMQAQPADP